MSHQESLHRRGETDHRRGFPGPLRTTRRPKAPTVARQDDIIDIDRENRRRRSVLHQGHCERFAVPLATRGIPKPRTTDGDPA